jgi:RNA polymerase sigma-70 factor (ECF subfamily)
MGAESATGDRRDSLLAFYDAALPHVYGYLSARCGPRPLVEDLTAETFLAAVDALRRDQLCVLSLPWIIGVARHKLADHWRRQARDERRIRALATETEEDEDPWDVQLNAVRVRQVLDELAVQHRGALTLRYCDDLPVADVAIHLGRSVHATEALLVRARTAFRRAYVDTTDDGFGGPSDGASNGKGGPGA